MSNGVLYHQLKLKSLSYKFPLMFLNHEAIKPQFLWILTFCFKATSSSYFLMVTKASLVSTALIQNTAKNIFWFTRVSSSFEGMSVNQSSWITWYLWRLVLAVYLWRLVLAVYLWLLVLVVYLWLLVLVVYLCRLVLALYRTQLTWH